MKNELKREAKKKKEKRETKRICLHYTTGMGTLNWGLLQCGPPEAGSMSYCFCPSFAPNPSVVRKRFQGCFATGYFPSAGYMVF